MTGTDWCQALGITPLELLPDLGECVFERNRPSVPAIQLLDPPLGFRRPGGLPLGLRQILGVTVEALQQPCGDVGAFLRGELERCRED